MPVPPQKLRALASEGNRDNSRKLEPAGEPYDGEGIDIDTRDERPERPKPKKERAR
jgi:hypothetical protein